MWTPTPEQAAAWTETWGTPSYVYCAPAAISAIQALRTATEGRARIWYALKANSNLEWLRALRPHVDGADVSSEGELRQALAAGFSGEQIGITGPAKSDAAHRAAVRAGATVSLESLSEIDDLARVAKSEGRVAQVLLRFNPVQKGHAFRFCTSGGPSPFGIDEAELPAAVRQVLGHAGTLRCAGVHVHSGSGCRSAAAWHRHAVGALDMADRAAALGLDLTRVNLGGGFSAASDGLDVAALGRKLSGTLAKFSAAHGPQVSVVLEPGRHLASDAGCLLVRVVRRIESRGTSIVVLDAGMSAFLFATERFQDGVPPTVVNLSRPDAPEAEVTLVGPSCTPLDTLGRGLRVPDPQPGDRLALGPAGAYGFGASPHLFLGHDVPAELIWDGEAVREARPRRQLSDFDRPT